MAWLAVLLALVASLLFAFGTAAQQRSAATVPDDRGRGPGLVLLLIRRPLWWAGAVSDVAGYVAQAAALGLGSLLLVQPLLITTLLFALPLSARWAGRRSSRADHAWAVLLSVALAVFLAVGGATPGVDRAGIRAWLPTGVVLGAVIVGSLVGAALRRGATRALLLGVATAVAYGLAAPLTKSVVNLLGSGLPAVVGSWETYALAVFLVGGTLLQQSAFQAGDLRASLPVVTVGEPVVAVAVGIAVLGERLGATGAEWVLIAVLVVAMGAATLALARSAADDGSAQREQDTDGEQPQQLGGSARPVRG
ncbi:MAG TPA: DMT family transporter [Blastococcus sp.]|nr:DMT family transporter [Blastococcus sp.]